MTCPTLAWIRLLTVALLLVLIGACGQPTIMTEETLQTMCQPESPADSPSGSQADTQLTSGWVESWNSAPVGPRAIHDSITGDVGVWTVSQVPFVPEDGTPIPVLGTSVSISPDGQLVMSARDEIGFNSAGSVAIVGLTLGDTVHGEIPLTPGTVISGRFRCDVYFQNPALLAQGEGVQAYFKINSESHQSGACTMVYSHELANINGEGSPPFFSVSDTFSRRLYDDCVSLRGLQGPWVEPAFVTEIYIAVGAHARSDINGVGVAECTCYIDNLAITEE